jgi:N-acetylglucosamine-6-phosphate deacetylase
MNRIQIYNARAITPCELIENACIIAERGQIKAVTKQYIENFDGDSIDAGGNYLSPGFIDIHVHGGGGYDFMDADAEGFGVIAETHAQHGTTSMCPTTLACSDAELFAMLGHYEQAKRNRFGAAIVGIHLEGPYFAPQQRGAQDLRYIKDAVPKEYSNILNQTDHIVRWSAAPEVAGVLEFARYIRSRGIVPSVAHTAALYDDIRGAIDAGFTHVTHLYSGMTGVTRINAKRYGGTIEAALYEDDLTVEIIADGVHLPPEILRYVYKFKGASKTALVTDAMRAAGTDAAESVLGSLSDGQRVIIEDGVAKLPDRSSFAGSIATADRLIKNMVRLAGVPLIDSVRMMTLTPARIIGVDNRKGSLSAGKDADLVIFDQDFNVCLTMIQGNIIKEKLT